MRLAPAVAVILLACSPSQVDIARATLTTTAYAAVQADKSFADAYEAASSDARAQAATQAEKDALMADWDAAADEVERLVEATYASLAAAEIALDAWESTGDDRDWQEALGCVAGHLGDLARVLEERSLTLPPPLVRLLKLTGGVQCR